MPTIQATFARRFGIGQTAKVVGVLYGLIGVFLLPIFLLTTAIGCAIYNAVAGWVGGIEVELDGA